jgi:hypothetical protein
VFIPQWAGLDFGGWRKVQCSFLGEKVEGLGFVDNETWPTVAIDSSTDIRSNLHGMHAFITVSDCKDYR